MPRLLRLAAVALSASAVCLSATWAAATPSPSPVQVPARVGVPKAVADELLVSYRSGAEPAERQRARDRGAVKLADRVVPGSGGRGGVELVRLPAGADRSRATRELTADPAVAYVEPNHTYTHQATSTDPRYTTGELWGLSGPTTVPAATYGSNAAAAWAAGRTGSATVYVGVIDEGIQHSHPDLTGQVRNPGEVAGNRIDDDRNGYVDDVYGWDFASNNASVYDGGTAGSADDHGTHVAGTIGAKANGAGVVGVNWNVRMISGKFLGSTGGTAAKAIKAIDYFTNLKNRGEHRRHQQLLGWRRLLQALKEAIERANQANIVFVAATTKSGARASFSNYGPTSVDLGAPGASIVSTTAYNGYSTYNGTSMATPHVTGAVALYASVKPGSSDTAIKAALLRSAVPTSALQGRTVTGGRLDVNAALGR